MVISTGEVTGEDAESGFTEQARHSSAGIWILTDSYWGASRMSEA